MSVILALSVLATSAAALPQEEVATTVCVGRSSIVRVEVPGDGASPLRLPCRSSDPGVVEVLEDVQLLPGAGAGTVRVRGVAVGEASLYVGEWEVRLAVQPLVGEARAWRRQATIVTPVDGAWIQGTVTVGVEVVCAQGPSDLEVHLELPDGRKLEPMPPMVSGAGPTLRRRFELDSSSLGPGTHELRAVVHEGGIEHASATHRVQVSSGESSLSGECEAALDLERPEGLGSRLPRVGGDELASGGAFVVLPRGDVTWVMPVEIDEPGRYQFLVRARGDLAGGAFPSIALSVDARAPIAGTTRLVDPRWQRVPVGPPVELAAGSHHLVLRLLNDLDVGDRSDRELFVDRWELVPVERPEAPDSMMMMAGTASSGGPRGPRGPGLWVGLERAFDGLDVNGRLWIRGAANWSGVERSAAPRIELVVDDVVLASQQTAKPAFALDRAHLGEGEHEFYLRASLPDGRTARTPVQRVQVPGPVAPVAARDLLSFDVLDERWDGGFTPYLDGQGEEARQLVVRPDRPVEATLHLPEELSGTFEVLVQARAGGGDRPAGASLIVGDGDPLTTGIQDWWSLRSFGTIELAEGAKVLTLRLEPQEQDPQLRVRALVLRGRRDRADHHPPRAKLLYPPAGHRAFAVDAAVVQAFDDDALASIDVVLDGRPQGTYGHVPHGAGALVAPLLLRGVAPGQHTLALRILDRSGNLTETTPVPFEVLAEEPAEPGPHARAVHLLNRLGLGPDAGELGELLHLGEQAWLERALADVSHGDLTARGYADTRAGDAIAYNAERLVLTHALRTDNPVRTRFVLWIDDHFSTWSGKTGLPTEWAEYREIARMGWAPFAEHLRQSATSAAMLVYLDQSQSFAGRINENYARELLELHTVGVDGGYDQDDVRALAHMLAGMTVSQEAPIDGSGVYQRRVFRFDPELSDGRACTLLERSFAPCPSDARFDRVTELLEVLASRPETAHFLARKLVEHYAGHPADEALVEDLARTYRTSGGDPRALLRALVAHPAFWESAGTDRLASPLDYGLRVARVCGVPAVDWSLREFLQNSGMGLFDRVSPDGYPDDDASWADTNGLMQRWRWVQRIPWAVRGLVPNQVRRYAGGDPEAWRQRIIDHAAVRLTGQLLGEESNRAALAFFEEDEADLWRRVDHLTVLICRLPESNFK